MITPAQAAVLQYLVDNPNGLLDIELSAREDRVRYFAWVACSKFPCRRGTIFALYKRGYFREATDEEVGNMTWGSFHRISDAGLQALAEYDPSKHVDKVSDKEKTAAVLKALLLRYDSDRYAKFPELPSVTGHAASYIDLWVMDLWPSNRFLTISFEIKASRGDFLHEIKDPAKRTAAMYLANQYYFATPKGLVDPDELPEGTGLMEISNSTAKVKVQAPVRRIEPPTWGFMATVARQASRRYVG